MTTARQDLFEYAPKFGVGVEIERWRDQVVAVIISAPPGRCFARASSWGRGKVSDDRTSVRYDRFPADGFIGGFANTTDLYREARYCLKRNIMLHLAFNSRKETGRC